MKCILCFSHTVLLLIFNSQIYVSKSTHKSVIFLCLIYYDLLPDDNFSNTIISYRF